MPARYLKAGRAPRPPETTLGWVHDAVDPHGTITAVESLSLSSTTLHAIDLRDRGYVAQQGSHENEAVTGMGWFRRRSPPVAVVMGGCPCRNVEEQGHPPFRPVADRRMLGSRLAGVDAARSSASSQDQIAGHPDSAHH